MKIRKSLKVVALTLGLALAFGATGCGNSSSSNVKLTKVGDEKITEEPTELSLFFIDTGDRHLEDLEIWKEIAKNTNVSFKTVSSKNASDEETAINTLMASGNLPDLIVYSDAKKFFPKYGKEGAFEKLNDLIESDAPNISKLINENKEVKAHLTASDGNIYWISSVNPKVPASGWFVRKDWLDKLGLQAPTTVEEFHDMLVAFREKDPNGNGQKDEVPYLNRFDGIGHLIFLFDCIPTWELKDGKIVFGPTTEEYKKGYTEVAKWYAEGLIDKEIYTRGTKSRDKLFGDNVGGVTHDYFGSTAQFNDMLKDSVPGFNIVPIAPPNGKEYTARDRVHMRGVGISSTSEKKNVAIRFIDYMFSEKGSLYANFGIEGKHYDMVDGYPKYQDWVLNGEKTTIDILDEAGAASAFPNMFDFRYEEQWLTPVAKQGMEDYQKYLAEPVPSLSYEGDDEDRFTKIMADVNTYVNEYAQKWIFGNASVEDTFDEYLEHLKKLGIDEATEIQNKAYDRYKKIMAE